MNIKALSLWQPWAALVAAGYKRFETRSKPTRYRGPLLICSAKKWTNDLARIEGNFIANYGVTLPPWTRQRGYGLCTVDVVNVWQVETNDMMANVEEPGSICGLPLFTQRAFGDFSPGRFIWELKNLRPLGEKSFPVVGKQFLFDVPIDASLLNL